jgi:hypothetical protein
MWLSHWKKAPTATILFRVGLKKESCEYWGSQASQVVKSLAIINVAIIIAHRECSKVNSVSGKLANSSYKICVTIYTVIYKQTVKNNLLRQVKHLYKFEPCVALDKAHQGLASNFLYCFYIQMHVRCN